MVPPIVGEVEICVLCLKILRHVHEFHLPSIAWQFYSYKSLLCQPGLAQDHQDFFFQSRAHGSIEQRTAARNSNCAF